MHNFNLTDETFDVNQSGNYILLMQSSLSGFTYGVCDAVRNKCILLKHFEKSSADWFEFRNYLTEVIHSDPNLQLRYKTVRHIIHHKEFTVIPEMYLPSGDLLQQYFPGLHKQGTAIVSATNAPAKSAVLSPYPEDLMHDLTKNYPGIKLSHVSMPFIHNLISESSRTLRHIFHVLVSDGYFLAGVAHSGKLDFINAFHVSTPEDMLFYMVSVLDKFKVALSTAEIFVQNETKNDTLLTVLKNNTGKVRNLKASPNMVYSYIFTEDVLERFANFLNLYHCE